MYQGEEEEGAKARSNSIDKFSVLLCIVKQHGRFANKFIKIYTEMRKPP
jgi:hypothetical protein